MKPWSQTPQSKQDTAASFIINWFSPTSFWLVTVDNYFLTAPISLCIWLGLSASQQCFSLTPNQLAVLQPIVYKPIQPKRTGLSLPKARAPWHACSIWICVHSLASLCMCTVANLQEFICAKTCRWRLWLYFCQVGSLFFLFFSALSMSKSSSN